MAPRGERMLRHLEIDGGAGLLDPTPYVPDVEEIRDGARKVGRSDLPARSQSAVRFRYAGSRIEPPNDGGGGPGDRLSGGMAESVAYQAQHAEAQSRHLRGISIRVDRDSAVWFRKPDRFQDRLSGLIAQTNDADREYDIE